MTSLQKQIGYVFKDEALLKLALTHPSIRKKKNNQRLEFLGDAVLGLVVAEMLYHMFPGEQEGELARRQAALVRGETLAKLAYNIGIGEDLHVASGEAATGGREKDSILEDAIEALIGAIYLDGGLPAAKEFIEAYWQELAEGIQAPPKDAKTALQEWAQSKGLAVPSYKVLKQTGSAHEPEFTIEVTLEGHPTYTAKAASKRAAQQAAAKLLLHRLES